MFASWWDVGFCFVLNICLWRPIELQYSRNQFIIWALWHVILLEAAIRRWALWCLNNAQFALKSQISVKISQTTLRAWILDIRQDGSMQITFHVNCSLSYLFLADKSDSRCGLLLLNLTCFNIVCSDMLFCILWLYRG